MIKTIIVLCISTENVLYGRDCTYYICRCICDIINAIINANNVIHLSLNRTADIGKSIV